MEWYYAEGEERRGPVSEATLLALRRSGEIGSDTRVWRDGFTGWISYREALEAGVTPPAPDGRRFCAECGTPHPPEEMVAYQQVFICAGCKDRFFQKLREGASLPGVREYAGFWVRLLAKMVDNFILGVLSLLVIIPLLLLLGGIPREAPQADGDIPVFALKVFGLEAGAMLLIYVMQAVYNVWFVGKYGATPGKMVAGIKVITADGKRPTYLRSLGRFGADLVTQATCNIGYLIAAFDDEKRALHDHICNTRVVRK